MSNKIFDFGFRIPDWTEQRRKSQNLQTAVRNSQSDGFTLIEVLLAMTILAVVLAVIYASFSTASRNVGEADVRREEADIARTLMARLSSEIANAYVKNMSVPTVFSSIKEESDGENGETIRHDGILMTTLTDPMSRKPESKELDLREVGYFFKEKPEGGGYSLYRREKRELSEDAPAGEGGEEYEITDRVRSLRFSFSENGSTWTDNGWDRSWGRLPKMVEISLVLDTGAVYTTRADVGNK